MILYSNLFLAKCGAKPDIDGGRDGKILSGLLKSRGWEEVRSLLQFFFEKPPHWVDANGKFTLYAFKSCYSELLVLWKRNKGLEGETKHELLTY